jgi:membrane protein YdbS with pleckstrin-like domain
MKHELPASPELGPGVEGEEVVWEGRYAMKNFLGRLSVRALLTVVWIALAAYTWGADHENLAIPTTLFGVGLLIAWLAIFYRIMLARYGHFYRLTNRRLFVSTGLMRRRRDQIELLRIKDVFTRQSLVERWLALGTVVVVPDDKSLPTFYLPGVDDPKRVMDIIWHYARAERDHRSVRVNQI